MDAMKYAAHFEKRGRENGEAFITLKEDAPGWLRDAVYEAHDGALPNDWVYAECFAACEAIDEGSITVSPEIDDDMEDVHGYVDARVDIYTKDRFRWAADMCLTELFANAEERATELCSDAMPMADRLGAVQYAAIERITEAMLEAVREFLEAQPQAEVPGV
jgi:hypothetical protein